MLAAVAGDRYEASKRGHLLAIEGAELGHVDQHRDRGEFADAGDGGEHVKVRGKIRLAGQAAFSSASIALI